MKININSTIVLLLLLAAGIALLSSCASTNDVPRDNTSANTIDDGYSSVNANNSSRNPYTLNPNADRKSNISLADMVRQLPGVMAAGRPGSWSFKVRGAESLYGGSLPLFVLDGRAVGTDFNAIANTLDANQVKYMRVLTGADAAIYGTRGANGVIVIKMKNKT